MTEASVTLHLHCPLQGTVPQFGPDAAQLLDLDPASLGRIENAGFGREPIRFELADGGQNTGVMILLITLAVLLMYRHIDRNPIAANELFGELAGDL